MLPRKPTRLELTQDDMTEYDEVKREREKARRAQATATGQQAGSTASAEGERRAERAAASEAVAGVFSR